MTVNGQTAVEVDLDSLDDKPWRKPGADITDYFNYGFTEETWAAYCNRYTYNTYRVSQKKVGSQKTSNCSNSLNFEAKIKCNTIKPNVPKWRKTCTGLKFDLLNFYGLRAIYILFEIPLFFDSPCINFYKLAIDNVLSPTEVYIDFYC